MEIVDKLLARIPADHPARARVEEAGLLLTVALEEFAEAALTAAQRERKAAARRLRIFVTHAQSGSFAQVVTAYAALREHYAIVPWRAVNDVLEGLFGEEGEQEVKRLASIEFAAKKREPAVPLASWRRPRLRRA